MVAPKRLQSWAAARPRDLHQPSSPFMEEVNQMNQELMPAYASLCSGVDRCLGKR